MRSVCSFLSVDALAACDGYSPFPMRLGLIGPLDGDASKLRDAVEFLVGDASVDQCVYLGLDDTIDSVLAAWANELMDGRASEDAFLDRVVRVAPQGKAKELEELLAADAAVQRLDVVRKLPPPPARAIEMIDDRIVMMIYDKALLDEEDIANANIVVYGKSSSHDLKRFGTRYFFTPGPVQAGHVGVIELEEDGRVTITVFDTAGTPVSREFLAARGGKVTVAV